MWTVERVALLVFVLTVGTFAYLLSLRHTAILFLSISFQTNVMGMAYFACIELGWMHMAALFQMLSFVYLGFVALFWALMLGGKEDNWPEYVFNSIIHYGTFAMVVWSMHNHKLRWPSHRFLYPYLAAYWFARPHIDAWLGWTMYPFDDYQVHVLFAFYGWVSVCLHYLRPGHD
jgi:hypothetical protein